MKKIVIIALSSTMGIHAGAGDHNTQGSKDDPTVVVFTQEELLAKDQRFMDAVDWKSDMLPTARVLIRAKNEQADFERWLSERATTFKID